MTTCKDCIHYYVCDSKGANCREDIGFGSDVIFITDSLKVEEQCDEFFPTVIRCKDCVSYEIGKEYEPYCNNINGLDEAKDNDFCSYGERKEYGNG